ncbi:tyrosine-type recombinase/integrase [Aerococcus suis]
MWVVPLENGKFKFTERYKDDLTGKTKYVSVTLTSKSKQAEKKTISILNNKIEEKENRTTTKELRFHDALDEWFNGHSKTIRPSSIVSTKSIIKIVKDKVDKDVLISRMDVRYMQNLMNGLDYSNSYLTHIKSIFNSVFDYAEKINAIENSPMPKVKINYKAKSLEDYKSTSEKYLTVDEAENLISTLKGSKRVIHCGYLAEFLYLTGARYNEAAILTEDDFDFDNNTVYISGTLDRTKGYKNAIKGPTKTAQSTRVVQLTTRTMNTVKEVIEFNRLMKLARPAYTDNGFLFTTKNGIPIANNAFNLTCKRIAKEIGIDKTISSHIFRHTHISILAENREPMKAIMQRVGHADERITNEIYTHVTQNTKETMLHNLEKQGF